MVGGYCVPTVALAVSWYIIIVIVCTAACSGYGEDAITSYCLSFIKTIVSLQILKQKTATKKRTPFTFQKDSFYSPKGLLLHNKCTPFGMQKGYIWFSSVIFGLFSHYFSAFQPLFIDFSAAVCQPFSRSFYTKWAMRSSRSPSSISITGTSIIV